MPTSRCRPRSRAASALALALFGALLTSAAAFAATATATDSTGTLPPYTWHIAPTPPCGGQPATLVFEAPPCAVDSYYVDDGASANVVWTRHLSTYTPTDSCAPFHGEYPLGTLAAGNFTVSWNDIERGVSANGTLVYRHVTRRLFEFTVVPNCGPGELPFVNHVRIGTRPAPCDTCRPEVCQGDSIRVFLEGTLPSRCWHVESVHWLPVASPLPRLVARVVVSDSTCSPIDNCFGGPVPWSARLVTGPMFMGDPVVTIDVWQKSCYAESTFVRGVGRRDFPFNIVPCGPVAGCIEPVIGVFDSLETPPCELIVGNAGTTTGTLSIRSGAWIAALQGRVALQGGTVTALHPAGPAAGWPIVTQPANDGSGALEFVMFSASGSLIPPGTHGVLRADARLADGVPGGALGGNVEMASDSAGAEVPLCIHIAPVGRPLGVCRLWGDTCDVNGDGLTNVRDLVTMARCLRQPGTCGLELFDCNRDGQFTLPDILCCARRILHGSGPDSAQAQPADGIALTFGDAERTADGVRLPVTLAGADRVGAASLRLAYPADRYEVASVEFTERSDWLQLSDTPEAGRVEIGLVALSESGPSQLPMTVTLRLKPGAQHGGDVSVASYDLSSPAGARLGGLATPQVPLDAPNLPAAVALSAARPNPSGGVTRFTVSLPRAADVDLGVFDLAGRRVATISHGRLAAGRTALEWNARDAHDGVYFVRLVVDGRTYGSRVTLLRTH